MDPKKLAAGAELLHAAAREHTDNPDIPDLYQAGGSYKEAIAALEALTAQNADVMLDLPKRVTLFSDDGQDPDTHRRSAMVHLSEMRSLLARAYEAAGRYHNAMGHLGSEETEGQF